MNTDQQIQLAELFLAASSILTVALAEARPERLKTAISLGGLVIGIAWALCMFAPLEHHPDLVAQVLRCLPFFAILGWGISSVIHGSRWNQPAPARES